MVSTAGNVILFGLIAVIILPLTVWFNRREIEQMRRIRLITLAAFHQPLQPSSSSCPSCSLRCRRSNSV